MQYAFYSEFSNAKSKPSHFALLESPEQHCRYIDIGDMQTVQKSSSNDIHTGSYCEFSKVEVNVDSREPTVTIYY